MKKGGGCKVFLMFILGIFLGFLLTVGGIAGAGYWAYNNMSITKLEQMLGTKIVNLGEYNDKPIKDLIGEVSTLTSMTISEIDDKLLEGNIKKNLILEINGNKVDLTKTLFSGIMGAKISTVTDEVGKIKDHLTFGVVYNDILIGSGMVLPDSPFAQKYKNVSLEDTLSNYGSEKISTLFEAGHDFGNDTIKAIYDAFASKNLTIDDLGDKDKLDDALDGIKIKDILSIDDSATGVLKAIKNWEFGDLKDSSSFDTLSINDVLSLDNTSTGVLGAIYEKNWTLADLKDSSKFDSLKVNDILELDSSSTGILKSLYEQDYTLADLKDDSSYDDLEINDILNLSSSSTGVLGAIYSKNWTIAQLKDSSNFDTLAVNDILDLDNTATGVLGAIYEKSWTLADLKDSSKFDTLKVNDILDLSSSSDGMLKAIYEQDWTLEDLKDSSSFDGLSVNAILSLSSSSTGILKAIYTEDWTLADLKDESKFDALSVNDILSLDGSESGILGAIAGKGWTLGDLKDSNNLDSLTIGEMMDIDSTSPKILQALQNSTTATLSSDISDLRLADVMDLGTKDYSTTGTSVMDSYKGFIGLVYETDMTDPKGPKITELKTKLDTIQVNNLTLGELQARGLISSTSDLTKTLGSKQLKDYTLQEVIDYVVVIAS